MDPNRLILLLLNVVLLCIGFALGYFFNLQLEPVLISVNPILAGSLLALGFFVLSTAFFGNLTPILFLYLGLVNSSLLLVNPVGVIALCFACAMASSGGNFLGEKAGLDMNAKESLSSHKKEAIAFLAISIAFGAIAGFLFSLELGFVIPTGFQLQI